MVQFVTPILDHFEEKKNNFMRGPKPLLYYRRSYITLGIIIKIETTLILLVNMIKFLIKLNVLDYF